MTPTNGSYNFGDRFDRIDNSIDEMKDDLAKAIRELTAAVQILNSKFDSFMMIAQNAIPMKAVALMFGVLVVSIAGIKGVDWLFNVYLKGAP